MKLMDAVKIVSVIAVGVGGSLIGLKAGHDLINERDDLRLKNELHQMEVDFLTYKGSDE